MINKIRFKDLSTPLKVIICAAGIKLGYNILVFILALMVVFLEL